MNLLNIDFSEILFRAKLISAFLSLVFGGTAIYFIMEFQKLVGVKAKLAKGALRFEESVSGGAGQSKWEEILRHMSSDREAEWKFAIIEADKLVDSSLKTAGYPGETMGERLTNIDKSQFVSLDGLWEAHKTRNKMVHDSSYFLRYSEAKKAIQFYEATLRELGVV